MPQVRLVLSAESGCVAGSLYDAVDNNGFYAFQQLGLAQLSAGLTISVQDNQTIFNITNYPQTATWSLLNPYTPGFNAPPL